MKFAPRTSHLALSLLFLTTTIRSQTQAPWCFDATPEDYQASIDFQNTHPQTTYYPDSEISVPLYIIYVNEDDGTPPENQYSLGDQLNHANQVFDGVFNFYICGYQHINSSTYTHLALAQEKPGLFNAFHVDYAVNVYIVRSFTDNSGDAVALFPWGQFPNNMIFLTRNKISSYTLGHELGHYLGLFHTFLRDYESPDYCTLKDPQTDIDMVADTPYDPGRTFGLCQQECPIATTPCTLTCNNNGNPVTYTYVNYLTGNVMSYHNCPDQEFTNGQIDRMLYFLSASDRSFLLSNQPECNNNIAEEGYVHMYCTPST